MMKSMCGASRAGRPISKVSTGVVWLGADIRDCSSAEALNLPVICALKKFELIFDLDAVAARYFSIIE
jgi:hypothetical protein